MADLPATRLGHHMKEARLRRSLAERAAPAGDSRSAKMRKRILPAAFAVLASLAIATEPAGIDEWPMLRPI